MNLGLSPPQRREIQLLIAGVGARGWQGEHLPWEPLVW